MDTIFAVIRSGKYDLAKIIDRIDYYFVKGDITAEEKDHLIAVARSGASGTIEMDYRAEILALWAAVHELQRKSEDPDEDPDEIPEYVQPTGAHDAYNTGDKVRYKGEVWECVMDNCVWAPDVYPAGWQKIEQGE